MGGYWGLFDQDGQPHAASIGAVTEDGQWWRGWLGALTGAAIGMLWFALWSRLARAHCGAGTVQVQETKIVGLLPVLACATLGAVAPVQWLMVQQWDRTSMERSISGILVLVGVVTIWASSLYSMKVFTRAEAAPGGCQECGVRWMRWSIPVSKLHHVLRDVVLFAAASAALVLLLDSRYRPFPWWWFIAPTVGLWVLRVANHSADRGSTYKQQVLASVLAVCAVAIALVEGWQNNQALGYCALLLTLAWGAAWPAGTNTSIASNSAGAHSSAV